MYKIIRIGGNDYKMEFTIEASLYQDFVEKLSKYVLDFSTLMAEYDINGKSIKNEKDLVKMSSEAVKSMFLTQTTQTPYLAMVGFYAGLMEHQKMSQEQAKELYKQYLTEYNKKPAEVLAEIMEKVQEDNFFQMIGLDIQKMKLPTQTKKTSTKVLRNKSRK